MIVSIDIVISALADAGGKRSYVSVYVLTEERE